MDRRISTLDIRALKNLGYSPERIGRMDVAEADHILYLKRKATEQGE